MKMLRSRAAASIAALAALSMTASPALARGYGGWDRHHHHRHGDGIDGGDLLAGLLIVGGIAAIASAASKSARDRQGNERDRYPGGPDYGEPEGRDYGDSSGQRDDEEAPDYGSSYPGVAPTNGSFDEAVDRCSEELERSDRRIGSVDSVGRMGEHYNVEGRLEDGRGFACSVDREGRVRSVAVDGSALI